MCTRDRFSESTADTEALRAIRAKSVMVLGAAGEAQASWGQRRLTRNSLVDVSFSVLSTEFVSRGAMT